MKLTARMLTALSVAAAAAHAGAHALLLDSTPKNGGTAAAPLAEMRLKYNEPLETAFSKVMLFGPDGKELSVGALHAVDGEANAIALPLPNLGPGLYKAQWSAMGRDGHRTKGSLSFTVK